MRISAPANHSPGRAQPSSAPNGRYTSSKIAWYAAVAASGLIGVTIGLAVRTHQACLHGQHGVNFGGLGNSHIGDHENLVPQSSQTAHTDRHHGQGRAASPQSYTVAPSAAIDAHPLLSLTSMAGVHHLVTETTTASPTTAGPTTAGPTTAEPTTAEPTTAEPTTAGPTTADPTTAGPTTATTPQAAILTPTEAPTHRPTLAPTTGSPVVARQADATARTATPTVSTSAPAVSTRAMLPGYHAFVDPLRSVLTPAGAQLLADVFSTHARSTLPFSIEVETACRWEYYDAAHWLNMCQSTNTSFLADQSAHREHCIGTDNAAVWCIKHGVEFAIPHIIALSPWAATSRQDPNISIVHVHGKCKGNENEGHLQCDKQIETKYGAPRKPWKRPKNAWYVMSDDFGKCGINGDMDTAVTQWQSPLLSINGEKWSYAADTPCTDQRRDVIVPTTNVIVPSTEGDTLRSAGGRARTAVRTTLAFMLRGSRYTARNQVVRIWGEDRDIHIVNSMPHNESIEKMLGSKFCIQADGQAPWSPRLVEYLTLGCVPVLLSSTLLPPFQRTLDWTKFSVQLPQSDVYKLKNILSTLVASGQYETLRRNVQAVADVFRYYLHSPSRGAIPLIVAEMLAVTRDTAPVALVKSPTWKPKQCLFMEDCPGGCSDARAKDRPDVIPFPCDPVVFSDCTRVPRGEPEKHGKSGIDFVWGEPKGANVTMCARKGVGYHKL